MKKLAFLGAAVGAGLGGLLLWNAPTHAADHLDAPAAASNQMADITDVYAWMDPSAQKVNLVMDVSPADPTGTGSAARHFGPSILYVFHVTSTSAFGTAGTETKVICKFASDTSAECWVGDKGYVQGNPMNTDGIASSDGKIRLFAGRRSDPFFFNFNGFVDAVTAIKAIPTTVPKNAASCYAGTNTATETTVETNATLVRTKLAEAAQGSAGHAPCVGSGSGAGGNRDCFIGFDVQAIVLQVDKSLLNIGSNTVLGVWASTNSPS